MIQQLLLAGQVLVLVLLYVFVWRVMRGARSDVLGTVAAQESMILPGAAVASARRAQLVVVESPTLRAGQHFALEGTLTLGRAPANDVTIDDPFASSRHAEVSANGRLIDLGSSNGTLVNGKPIDGQAQLRSGDRVQIGETIFGFEVQG